VRVVSTCLLVSALGASACVHEDDVTGPTTADVTSADGKSDGVAQIAVREGQTSTITFTANGGPIGFSVDCGISSDPDSVGTLFTVASDALDVSTPVHASFWRWTGEADAGQGSLEITGEGGSRTCSVRMFTVGGTCTRSNAFRTPETGHTHLRVNTTVSTWGDFPAAGNHWGAWAPWDRTYARPVKRGFYLHNLEHGGLVLSYGCSSPTQSAACQEAADNLEAAKAELGEARVIVTPDPDQPTMYGVRGWRMAYQSDCFDPAATVDYMAAFFRHGREDIDADPPIDYDPTTLNVPCVNLMAAPDSCN
jgi:hypothetical protein